MTVAYKIFELTGWTWQVSHSQKFMELKGIVKGVNDPSFTMVKAMVLNSFYELGAWCTSIIVQQTDGTHAAGPRRKLFYHGHKRPVPCTTGDRWPGAANHTQAALDAQTSDKKKSDV